jgi:hypothetical protein
MDLLLKLAADAGHQVSLAEHAVEEQAYDSARDALDRAADQLAALRERWPEMSASERAVIGPSAQAVKARLEECAAAVPRRAVLSQGTAVADAEQETEPPLPPAG